MLHLRLRLRLRLRVRCVWEHRLVLVLVLFKHRQLVVQALSVVARVEQVRVAAVVIDARFELPPTQRDQLRREAWVKAWV